MTVSSNSEELSTFFISFYIVAVILTLQTPEAYGIFQAITLFYAAVITKKSVLCPLLDVLVEVQTMFAFEQ